MSHAAVSEARDTRKPEIQESRWDFTRLFPRWGAGEKNDNLPGNHLSATTLPCSQGVVNESPFEGIHSNAGCREREGALR